MSQDFGDITHNNISRQNNLSQYWNFIMRFTPAAIALSTLLLTVSSVGYSQNQDDMISPQASIFMKKGDDSRQANQLSEAIGWYETALAVHPRNRKAYIALAQIAEQQLLTGKAITLYKEVLEINPNDQTALIQQGRLFAMKGAVERAEDNLARLKLLCGVNCNANETLKVAITEAQEKGKILASDITVNPDSESQN